jgi:hypothetical protein
MLLEMRQIAGAGPDYERHGNISLKMEQHLFTLADKCKILGKS